MAIVDPVQETLARIARLRAAVAAERAALSALALDRLETLADQRHALDAAWADVLTTFREARAEGDPQLEWAHRQMLADLDALRRVWSNDRRRRAAHGAAFEALAAALEAPTSPGPAAVLPLTRGQ